MILEALATTRSYALGPMADELAHRSRSFPMGSTIVLATAFLPPELALVLDDLKGRGHKVVVIYVGDEPGSRPAEGIIFHDLRDYFVKMEAAVGPLEG